MSNLIVFLVCVLGQLQPVRQTSLLLSPMTLERATSQYEAQIGSRETLAAMAALDSLSDKVFWTFRDRKVSWDSQLQKIAIKTNGDSSDVDNAIDEHGRLVFESAELSGWVDVDVVHNRIVIQTPSTFGIIQLVTDGNGESYSIAAEHVYCVCQANGGNTLCPMQSCNDNLGCRAGDPPNQQDGECIKITETHGKYACGASVATAPMAMTVLSLVGWKTSRRKKKINRIRK